MTESEARLSPRLEASRRMTEAWRRMIEEGHFEQYRTMSTAQIDSIQGELPDNSGFSKESNPVRDYLVALKDYLNS